MYDNDSETRFFNRYYQEGLFLEERSVLTPYIKWTDKIL